MKKKKRFFYVVIAIGIAIALLIVKFVSPYFLTGGKFDNNYESKDLEENYIKKELEILELREYLESIIPEKTGISFGYSDRSDRFDLGVIKYNPETKNIERPNNMSATNVSLNSKSVTNILQNMDWTSGELYTLLQKLKSANCIRIYKQPFSGKPVQITFRKGGHLGVAEYSYHLFSEPLTDSLKRVWENKEGFRVYNENVLFEYGYPL